MLNVRLFIRETADTASFALREFFRPLTVVAHFLMRYSFFALLLPGLLGCSHPTVKEVALLKGHTKPVRSISFAPDGKTLASGSADGTIRIWDLETRKEIARFNEPDGNVITVAFTPDGKSLASCCRNRPTVRLWDVATGKVRSSLDCRTEGVSDLSISPDGKMLAASCWSEAQVRLWDLRTDKLVLTLTGHTGRLMTRIGFSPDGKILASAATIKREELSGVIVNTRYEGEVKIWEVASGKEVLTIHGHEERIYCLRFAPDGKTLTTGGNDGLAKVWDAVTGKELATLNGHRGPNSTLDDLAFSPNGKILATASLDKTILLWDLSTRKVVGILKGDPTPLCCVAFAGNGKTIISGHQDGGIRIWDVTSLLPD